VTTDRAVVVALEEFGAGFARVAVPGGAGDLVDPAVAVNVERGAADVGAGAAAHIMLNPPGGPNVFEPPHFARLAHDPVEVAVLVDVHQRGLAHAPTHLGDLVILKPRHLRPRRGRHEQDDGTHD